MLICSTQMPCTPLGTFHRTAREVAKTHCSIQTIKVSISFYTVPQQRKFKEKKIIHTAWNCNSFPALKSQKIHIFLFFSSFLSLLIKALASFSSATRCRKSSALTSHFQTADPVDSVDPWHLALLAPALKTPNGRPSAWGHHSLENLPRSFVLYTYFFSMGFLTKNYPEIILLCFACVSIWRPRIVNWVKSSKKKTFCPKSKQQHNLLSAGGVAVLAFWGASFGDFAAPVGDFVSSCEIWRLAQIVFFFEFLRTFFF